MTPRVWINYTTFGRDLEWLGYSMESFKKFATGFSGVTIVVPTWDLDKFLPFEKKYGTDECPVLVKTFLEYPQKGFVHHLAMKCYADVFAPSADMILHMDPDCLWSEPVSPKDYIINGNPVLVIESYDVLKHYFHGRYGWKLVTQEALKFDCPYETMCRHPAIHRKELYGRMRTYMEAVHQTPFLDFVLKQRNSFPQGFGEFNTLGAFAVKFMASEYHFHDCSNERMKNMDKLVVKPELKIGHPNEKLWQGWSYTGAGNNMDQIRKILS